MINEPLKRGTKCYWKRNGAYECAYFLSLNMMPTAPHAVTIRHNGSEAIVKDFEVFTELDKFKDRYKHILSRFVTGKENKADIARTICSPYHRVLRVFKQAKEKGIICVQETEKV